MGGKINFEEIYISYNDIEADLIRNLLEDYSIPCIVRDMKITPYPISLGVFAERRIAVEEEMVEKAKKIIIDAINDGYISRDGRFK